MSQCYMRLSAAEREEISRSIALGFRCRAIARQLQRNVSTLSRELHRHAPILTLIERHWPTVAPGILSDAHAVRERVLSSSSGACCNARMDISTAPSYRGYRFPVEIISHCAWL